MKIRVINFVWIVVLFFANSCSDPMEETSKLQPLIATSTPIEYPDKPNVILITADDLGMHLGYLGDPFARSSGLDKMASEGAIFNNAYVTQSTCSPSRSSILTGKYNFQNGHYGQWRHDYKINEDLTTLPEFLNASGYKTGIIGKLAVSPESKFPFDLLETSPHQTRRVSKVKSIAKTFFLDHPDDPKFLMINYLDPHRAYDRPRHGDIPRVLQTENDVDAFPFSGVNSINLRKDIAGYYNAIARMDYGIRLLVEMLEDLGETENTMIIFVSDHGAPFERAKGTNYEAGLKVPMLFYFPGFIPPATVVDDFVSTLDIYASIADVVSKGEAKVDIEGESLIPSVVLGKRLIHRNYVYGEFNSHGRQHFYPKRSISDGNVKLIHNLITDIDFPLYGGIEDANSIDLAERSTNTVVKNAYATLKSPPEFELYDLNTDPYELVNLYGHEKYQQETERLYSGLMKWRTEANDPFLDPEFLNEQKKLHGL